METLEKLDVRARELSLMTGTDSAQVYRVLQGRAKHIPPSILSVLSELGEDTDELIGKYNEYREERQHELLESVKQRVGGDR